MHAITVKEYGAPAELTEVPDPQPGPGRVLIAVEAAGLNPVDRVIADGGLQAQARAQFPLVLGSDVAGVIEAVGEGAAKFAPGEEVFGQLLIPPFGSSGTLGSTSKGADIIAVDITAQVGWVPYPTRS